MIAPEVLNKLPSVFNAGAAASVSCTIQFMTSGPAYVTIDNGTCTITEGVTPSANLTVTISDQNFVDLVRGKLNPVTGLMLRKLKAEGDLDLGLRFAGFFDGTNL